MLAFFQSGSGAAALAMFALCWVALFVALALWWWLRSVAVSLASLAVARARVFFARRGRLLPSGRSQVVLRSQLCQRAHWGLQFPLLWALRGRWVRWQASRRYRALCRARAA